RPPGRPVPPVRRRPPRAAGRLVLEVLEDAGRALAAADAHGDHAVAGPAAGQLGQELDGELGAGGAHGVAEGDGAAVDVDLVEVEAQLAEDGQGLGGEPLVELDQVNVVQAEPGQLQHLGDGHGGADAHDVGRDPADGVAHEPAQEGQ